MTSQGANRGAATSAPLADRLCRALHAIAAERRQSCCNSGKPIKLAQEQCRAQLGQALRRGRIQLDAAKVENCEAAIASAHRGCDWVGPLPGELPAACQQLFRGGLVADARCHSSLECAAGLHCKGAGPNSPGKCAAAQQPGARCGAAVDPLAVYTRQNAFREQHPECTGYCDKNRCRAPIALGHRCSSDIQCDTGSRCVDQRCIAGGLAGAGDACTDGRCTAGSRCFKQRCVRPRPAGSRCTSDFQCIGGCIRKPGHTDGVCGKQCRLTAQMAHSVVR